MTRTMLQRSIGLLTLALFLATGVGVPVHHHADHHGGETHLSAGDHGHGAMLIVRDVRTERPAAQVDLPPASTLLELSEPPAAQESETSRAPSIPRGRSPPSQILPRGPPSTS